MIGYRDRTWCSGKDCDGSCNRVFTEEDKKKAIEWWGGEDFPLVVADFHKVKEE